MIATSFGRMLAVPLFCFGLSAAVADAQRGPVIERLEPTSGPPGTVLQIVGRGFVTGATARVGDVELAVERVSPSRIVARVDHQTVSGVVTVSTAAGSMRGPTFRVTALPPAPLLSGFSPQSGPPGTEVLLSGSGFGPGFARTRVSLAGRPIVVRSASSTELRVIVPEGAVSGSFDIEVREAGSVQSTTAFSVSARTEIQRVEPAGAAVGSLVTIHGTGFSLDLAKNRVFLGNRRCIVESATETALQIRVPARAETGRLLLDVRGAGRAESTTDLVVQRVPTLASVAPSRSIVGSTITLTGTNFGTDVAAVKIQLGELELPVRELTPTRAVVELPATATTGTLSLTVHGVGPAALKAPFEVLEPLVLSAFEPRSGPVGTIVTLTGAGFSPARADNRVRIGARSLDVLTASSTQLRVRVTPGSSGAVEVTVVGSGDARSSDPYVLTMPPMVSGYSPARGAVGTEVSIRGQRFGSDPLAVSATLGGEVLEVVSVQDDLLVVRIGIGQETGTLEVGTALQGKTSVSPPFVVVPSLVVLRALPVSARVGETIDVRGFGFAAGAVVVLGDMLIEPESITGERIRFKLPADASGGLLTVRLRDGREATAPRPLTMIP